MARGDNDERVDGLSLDDLFEAFEESGFDTTMPIVFKYDGITLDVGAIQSGGSTGNTVHFILEEDL